MKRKLYFDSYCNTNYYALFEDGALCEYRSEDADIADAVGNVYKGRVTDVLGGMQAAFVDCGLERRCYLSADDLSPDIKGADGDGDVPRILNLKEGDEIIVQIIKPAVGKKGAKVTTNISFVGKYTVYMPVTPFIGVSRKITDRELKNNLLFSAKKVAREGEGIIVRTAAPYAVLGDKVSEINFFRSLYENLRSRFDEAPVGELLYSDSPLHICALRDLMLTASDEVHVGNKVLYESVKRITEVYPEHNKPEIILHDEHVDMFYSEGISEQILKAMQPKAELANGAYLIIDRTEALTAIDVNTGKFTGGESLEDTVYATNVLAAKEIARQVRLRNLGGLFVVDFIDMTNENHKKAIVQELERALKADKGKCTVLPMSRFGLVEFNRRRTGNASAEAKQTACKACGGSGETRSLLSLAAEFRARLLEVLSGGAEVICADMNIEVANFVLNYKVLKHNLSALYPNAKVYVIGHRTYRDTAFAFRSLEGENAAPPDGSALLY